MIFYFSGTGNSKHIAKNLSDKELVDLAGANKAGKYVYEVGKDASVGFVVPVYYSGVPKTVLDFVKKLELKGEVTYIYCVLTHGGGPGGAGSMLESVLKKKGYKLNACFDVKMASNYIMFSDLKPDSEIIERIKNVNDLLEPVKNAIDNRKHILPGWTKMDRILTASMLPLCNKNMSAKKFYADEDCIGCGKCERNCPAGIIKIVNKKPQWTANECVRCMACLSCEHVQFGKDTKERRRYSYEKYADKIN